MKIKLLLLLLIFATGFSSGQIQIGTGTNESQAVPFEPYYGFSYSQSVYLQSEINASGNITSIQWFYSGTTALSNSQELVIYMAEDVKASYASTTDWLPSTALTQVYSGGITVTAPGTDEWITITLDTPFNYSNTNNLIVAVDENRASYDSISDDFHTSSVTTNRSIYYRSDSTNPDPVSPPTGTMLSYIPNIILGGIQQACPDVSSLTATGITATSANLGWTVTGSEILWDIEYGADGFTQGAGTIVAANSNPYTLNTLTESTDYDYYVRANCGAGDYSEWAGPFSFTTLCAAEIPDYLEDFSSYIPSCWAEAVDGDPVNGPSSLGSSNWAEEEFAHLGSGLGGVNINIYQTGEIEWLLSPQFDLSAGGYEINLDVAFTNYNATTQGVFDSDDDVRLLYTLDGVTWNTIVQWNAANGNTPAAAGETFNADLSAITGSNVQFAIYSDEGATASGDKDFHIDNFQVRTIPSCQEPTVLTAANITATSADLGWTVSGSAETMWDVEYGVTGFTQGGVASTIIDNTSNNPYNASGLTESTDYDFYVRAHCGVGNESAWAGPFSFSTPASCLIPTALSAANITATSADLSWISGGSGEASWEVEYGVDGFTQGAGNIITPATNPYNLNALTANTAYDYYVRANCSGGDFSEWVGPYSFTTPCVAFNIPFTENFDSSTTGSSSNTNAPNCWSFIDSGSGYVYVYDNSATNVQSGAKSYRFYNGFDSSGDYMLISPEIAELTTDGVQVQFSAKGANGQELELGTITDPNDASTFTVLATTTLTSSSFEDIEINIPTSTDSYFAVRHGQTGTYDSYYLDDFSFVELPNCVKPTSLNVTGITATSADLTWISGGSGESSWEIEYGIDGFTQGTIDGTIVSATSNPYSLSSLLESADYDYYVRANCSGGEFSEWVGPFSFTTPASCLVPSMLSASNITSSSADLSWTSGGSGESSWEVEYGIDGFTQGTGTLVSPATNPQSISGLIASEDYDYYVRANCGGGDFSEWAGPYSFTTACNAISSFPAFEDFEANNNCLDSQVTTGTTGWVRDASGGSGDISSSYDGLGFMEKNYTSSVAEFYSEPYDLSGESGNFRINVWLHRHGSAHINDNYDIYFNSSKSLTGATLITSMKSDIDEAPVVPSTGWYNYIYDVPITYNSSNSVYFIVVGTTTAGFSSYDLGIDNLMMEKSPVDYIWNGASWNNIPEGNITTNDNMIVQVGTTPSLTSAISVGNLTLEAGASLEVDNGDITVTGNLENNGSITGVNQVILSGAAASVTGVGSMTNLTVDATGDVTMNGMQSISEQLDVVSGGQLDANGNITLVSNAMGTARVDVVDAGAITGNVNVERYIPAGNRAFRFIGSTVSGPSVYDSWQEAGVNATGFGVQITGTAGTAGTVNATTGHDETTTGNASMFKWDASNQSWTTVTNTKTEILNAGDYYRLFVRGDRMTDLAAATAPAHTETTLRASGSLMTGSMTVTPGITSGEFFAFANPYQSKLSTENIVASGVGADMYYWDPALGEFGGYSAIPYASASGTTGSAGVATNVLDAGQAVFFVDNSGSASVTIAESNKVDGTTNGGVFNVVPLQQALRLKIYQTSRFNNGQTESDGLYLDFNAAHNINVDANDALKLNGLNVNMAITKPSGELLTVERRTLPTTNESLGLNITNYLTNAYTINATVDVLPGLTAYLKDNFTGTMTELVQGTSTALDFTVDMNNAQSLDALRFELVFQVVTLSNEDLSFGSNLSIYPNPVKGDVLTINMSDINIEKAQIEIYNTLGQQIMSHTYDNISNGVIEIGNLSKLNNGVYIMNISSEDAKTTCRFIKE